MYRVLSSGFWCVKKRAGPRMQIRIIGRKKMFSLSSLGSAIFACISGFSAEELPYVSHEPAARVVIASDPEATDAFRARPGVVHALVNRAVTNLLGVNSISGAWKTLVSPQDVVGIKVFSSPGPHSGTRPSVVEPIVEGLLAAGVPADHVIIWDRQITDLRLAGFSDLARKYKVRLAGA